MKKLASMVLLFLVLVPGVSRCSLAAHYVVIEPVIPGDKNFIVECIWSSSKFSLHGGGNKMKQKFFVADAGEWVNCGFSLWDLIETPDSFHVRIYHPMGGGGAGLRAVEKRTDAKGVTRKVYVVRQRAAREDVDEMIAYYSGWELFFKLRSYAGGILLNVTNYATRYEEVTGHPVDVADMRRRYSDHLLKELEYIAAQPVIDEFRGRYDIWLLEDPRYYLERKWMKMENAQQAPASRGKP